MASIVSTVTVAYVAKSHKAVQDLDSKSWFHCAAPIFEGIPTGTRLKLTVDSESNKVVGGEVLTPSQAAAAKPAKASKPAPVAPAPTPAPALATTTDTAGSTVCGYCGVSRHNSHYSAKQVRRECAERQFLRETATVVDDAVPASVLTYALWLAEAPRTVFAATVKGHEVIGGPATPAPTPPTTPAAAPAAKPASKPATLKGGKAATVKADKAIIQAGAALVAAPAPTSATSTWDGLFAQHASKTPGLFKFVTGQDMPGAKGHGNWIVATDPTVVTGVLKAVVNDRVRVTLSDATAKTPVVTAFEILGTAAQETGLVKGIATSGKQQAPAPKGQKADKIVVAGRTARKAATVAVAAADRAEAAAAALAPAPAPALTGTVLTGPKQSKAAANKAARIAKLQEAIAVGKAKRA